MLLLQSVFQKHGKLVKRVPIYPVPSFLCSISFISKVEWEKLSPPPVSPSRSYHWLTRNTSDARCVWGFHTPNNSATLSGRPTIWLRSDAICLEMASDPTG